MSNSAFTPAVLTIPAAATTATGELNVISNPSAASLSTTGWTGVTAVGTNSPLNPTVTTAFSIANTAGAESSTSGGYASFTMPSGLQNKKLKVEFYYTTPATDVYKVSVYKGGSRVTLTTDSSGSTTLPASTTGKFVAYFDTDTTANWTVNITRTSGSTGPIYVTNVIVGPGIQPQGAVVGEWISYTPTITNVTIGNGTITGQYRRIGSSVQIRASVKFGSTSSLGGVPVVSLPSGLTVDTTKISTDPVSIVGDVFIKDATGSSYIGNAVYDSTGVAIYGADDAATGVTYAAISGLFTWTTNDYFTSEFSLPIAEWASSGTVQLAQNDVEYAYNTDASSTAIVINTGFAYGPAGVAFGSNWAVGTIYTRRVRFQTPIQAGDRLTIEVSLNNGGNNTWYPLNEIIGASIVTGSTYSYGYRFANVASNSTDIDVEFQNGGARPGGTFGTATGTAWTSYTTFNWRVRKSSAGAAVGFGVVNSVSTGLATPMTAQTALTFSASTPTATIVRAVGIAYTDIGGIWRLRFNASWTVASASRALASVTFSGVTFKNVASLLQTFSAVSSAGGIATVGYCTVNSGTITVEHATATTTAYHVSGDVELESKPTWA